jgi:alkylated DNA nucleotide flippase Atl1
MSTKQEHLTEVILKLNRYCQRATYGAIGEIVGLPARSVMNDQPKSQLNSWVVTKRIGLPTGYRKSECHPNLERCAEIISSAKILATWLRNHP